MGQWFWMCPMMCDCNLVKVKAANRVRWDELAQIMKMCCEHTLISEGIEVMPKVEICIFVVATYRLYEESWRIAWIRESVQHSIDINGTVCYVGCASKNITKFVHIVIPFQVLRIYDWESFQDVWRPCAEILWVFFQLPPFCKVGGCDTMLQLWQWNAVW